MTGRFCMNCGTLLPEEAKYCFNCGSLQEIIKEKKTDISKTISLADFEKIIDNRIQNCRFNKESTEPISDKPNSKNIVVGGVEIALIPRKDGILKSVMIAREFGSDQVTKELYDDFVLTTAETLLGVLPSEWQDVSKKIRHYDNEKNPFSYNGYDIYTIEIFGYTIFFNLSNGNAIQKPKTSYPKINFPIVCDSFRNYFNDLIEENFFEIPEIKSKINNHNGVSYNYFYYYFPGQNIVCIISDSNDILDRVVVILQTGIDGNYQLYSRLIHCVANTFCAGTDDDYTEKIDELDKKHGSTYKSQLFDRFSINKDWGKLYKKYDSYWTTFIPRKPTD